MPDNDSGYYEQLARAFSQPTPSFFTNPRWGRPAEMVEISTPASPEITWRDIILDRVKKVGGSQAAVQTRTCNSCRETKLRNEFSELYFTCKTCYGRLYASCSSCGTTRKKEEVYKYKNTDQCYSCINPVLGYTTDVLSKRRWNPSEGANGRYYGVELEVYGPKGFQQQAVQALQDIEQWGIIKSDSSIKGSSGFEIVSIPGTYKETLGYWLPFLKRIPKGLVGHIGGCGMHVHVSRVSMSSSTIRNLSVFLNDVLNRKFLEHIAGRRLNHYCKQNPYISYGSDTAEMARDRYSIFNTTQSNTVEFRMFKSTVRTKTFEKNLQFVSAAIDFCSTLTGGKDRHYTDFIAFLESHNLSDSKYKLLNEASKSFRAVDDPF